MSETFTKLFGSITDSTIWAEDNATRLVWITMLAMADRHGYVGASVPGLAHRARVTTEEAAAALDKFLAPDPYSRSQEQEGRRIEVADRGWTLLNYERFRDMRDEEARKEYERNRKRAQRAAAKGVPEGPAVSQPMVPDSPGQSPDVPQSMPASAQAEGELKAAGDPEREREDHARAIPFDGPPVPPIHPDQSASLAAQFVHECNADRPPGCRSWGGRAEQARVADMLVAHGLEKCRAVVASVRARIGKDLDAEDWSKLWARDGEIFHIRMQEMEGKSGKARKLSGAALQASRDAAAKKLKVMQEEDEQDGHT